jgi:hypothetical protein
MKTVRSPNLAPNDPGIMVMVTMGRGYARGGLVRAAGKVRGAGRFGDTMLVHINEREFAQLKRAWGEPHYNPDTELPEFFDWWDAAKTVAPYVIGALGSKSSIDQANRNPAPPDDPNMTTRMSNYTSSRTAIPQPHQDQSTFYKYGQGPETQFFKNNSLSDVTGPPGAQITRPPQFSPSTGQSILTGLTGGALKWALQNPDKVKDLFKGNSAPAAAAPAAAAAAAAGAPAASSGALGGASIPWEDLTDAQALTEYTPTAAMAGAPAAAATADAAAAGGSGLLPGSIAGADMADTGVAINPAMMEATSATPASGGLSALGGVGIGAGALVALTAFNNYFRQNHEMTPQDYLKQWGGQSFAAMQQAAAAHAAGDTAKEKQYLALANTSKGLMNLTNSSLAGNYVPNVTINRDPGYGRNAKPMARGGLTGYADGGWVGPPDPAQMMGAASMPMTGVGGLGLQPSSGLASLANSSNQLDPTGTGNDPHNWIKTATGYQIDPNNPLKSYMMPPGGGSIGQPPPPGTQPPPPSPAAGGSLTNMLNAQKAGATWDTTPWNMPGYGLQSGLVPPDQRQKMIDNAGKMSIDDPRLVSGPMSPVPGAPGAGPGTAGAMPPPMNLHSSIGQASTPAQWAQFNANQPGGLGGPPQGGLGIQRPPMPNPGMPPPTPGAYGVPPRPVGIGAPPAVQRAPPPVQPRLPIQRPSYGGALSRFGATPMGYGMMGRGDSMRRAEGGPVHGPGTGTSDDIPARLSAGEYVIPAHVVAALGDGSTSAGAAKLDQLQRNVRRSVGRQMAAGQHPRSAKEPIAYMGGGKV